MREIFVLFSNMAAVCVRFFLCLFLIARMLSAKKPGRNCLLPCFFGAAVISVLVYGAGLTDFSSVALETLWIVVCASYFSGGDKRMSLFVGIFFEIAVSLLKFLIGAWTGVFFRSPALLDSGTAGGQMVLWVVHGLLVFIGFFLWKHPDIEGRDAFRFASSFAVAGLIAVVTLSQQTRLPIGEDTLYMWTILAVIFLMSILVFHIGKNYEMEKELAELKSQQAMLLERDYTALNKAYEVNAKLFHDFHNHIGALYHLLSAGKQQEALWYLEELKAPVQGIAENLWTGDETLDYLINSKSKAAEDRDISLQVMVEFPRHTNLKSADLCAILGNLLDNAIEAADKVPKGGERFIRLNIRRIHQMLVIKVENSYNALPVKKDGALVTSKEDNGLHGWGIKRARTAAEKYEGTVHTSYSGGTFSAVATLCFQGVKTE